MKRIEFALISAFHTGWEKTIDTVTSSPCLWFYFIFHFFSSTFLPHRSDEPIAGVASFYSFYFCLTFFIYPVELFVLLFSLFLSFSFFFVGRFCVKLHRLRPEVLSATPPFWGGGFELFWLGASTSPRLPSFIEFYRVSPSFTEFYQVLRDFIKFYGVLPSFTEFLVGKSLIFFSIPIFVCVGFTWAFIYLLFSYWSGFSRFNRVLPCFTYD